jgi:hypothetical protein
MIDEREAGFQVEETDRGVVYRLPANLIGWGRRGALGVVGLGLCFMFCGVFSIASPWIVAKPGPPRASGWGSADDWWMLLGSLVFLAMGLVMVVYHLWVAFGRDEVILDERFLSAIIRIGPFRWRRRVRRERVGRFTVVARGQGVPGSQFHFGTASNLRAELGGGSSLTLARLHPHDLLRAVADSLSRRSLLIAVESDDGFGDAIAKVKVAEDTDDPQDVRERPVQPTPSNAVLERFADGLKITIPREGLSILWGSSRGLVLVAAVFAPAGIFATISLWGAAILGSHIPWGDGDGKESTSLVFLILFPIPFLTIGIGSLLWTIQAVVRTVRITLRDGTLTIDRRGLFGRKIRDMPLDEVNSIAVRVHKHEGDGSPSWTNDLGIELKDSTSVGLLSYRRKDELEWIATTLREAMGRTAGAQVRTDDGPA